MFLTENILLAFESLRANKMRAFLTMLGIIIGVASVIAIMSVGNALSSSVTTQMQGLGTNNYMINVREKDSDFGEMHGDGGGISGAKLSATDSDLITTEMLDSYLERFRNQVQAISLEEAAGSGQIKEERSYANVSTSGVNPGYREVNNVEMLGGRFINNSDMASGKNVAVVSDKLISNIFGSKEEGLGKEIKLYAAGGIKSYTVIGVYKYEESSMFFGMSSSSEKDIQTSMYIPITLVKQEASLKNYSMATIMSKTNVNDQKFVDDTKEFFTKYYDNNSRWEVSVFSMSSQIEMATTMLSTISMAIAIIAAISLVVGGIGVMNIMLVSVTERTKEIGTRKALGAKNFHVRMQFITEAMILSFVGGAIGLILGLVLGNIGSILIGATATFSIPMILLTVAFSMAIGIFFGYYPANKAAKLDPIDALRYE